jgi:hypothetical protein
MPTPLQFASSAFQFSRKRQARVDADVRIHDSISEVQLSLMTCTEKELGAGFGCRRSVDSLIACETSGCLVHFISTRVGHRSSGPAESFVRSSAIEPA